MMMNNQNMMVFSVELGFTALPHLPDLPARGIPDSPAHQPDNLLTICKCWHFDGQASPNPNRP
jgi:hypothetical protein